MYTVQVMNWPPNLKTRSTHPPVWSDHTVIEQMETEQAELQEARAVERLLSLYCTSTRIVKSLPGGAQEVVR